MGPEEESGFFSSNSPCSREDRREAREWQVALFFPASLYPPAQGSQAHKQQRSSLGFTSSQGIFLALLGVLLPTPRVVQLAPWESRPLGAWEPPLDSSPVTTSFAPCVASEQPAGCNYGLGLFRTVAADQRVQQVDSRRRRGSFFKCSFSGSSFCPTVDRECCLTRKAALRESFLVLFDDGGEK